MPVKELAGNTPTTIGCTVADREEVREFATLRGMENQRVLRLLLEGWKLLSEEQVAQAHQRFAARSRRPKAKLQPANA